jgi:hydroxymethylpyrimidine/phosphomethylpyrimidine kinase
MYGADCAWLSSFLFRLAPWLNGERIDNPNTHGTGCTLSSAIAANLAQGLSIEESVKAAKEYLTGALKAGLNLGSGSGPLDHTYWLDINK